MHGSWQEYMLRLHNKLKAQKQQWRIDAPWYFEDSEQLDENDDYEYNPEQLEEDKKYEHILMKHIDEDGMVDHAAYKKNVAIEKEKNNEFSSPMQPETVTHTVDNDEDYDPANYWLMLAGELNWDQEHFMRHTSIEKKRNEEAKAPKKPRTVTHMSNNE